MNIKDNAANIVSISRIFVAFVAIALLFKHTTCAYVWAVILTIIAFIMDGVDGYVARKFNQSSEWGSVLDIMGDRIVELCGDISKIELFARQAADGWDRWGLEAPDD